MDGHFLKFPYIRGTKYASTYVYFFWLLGHLTFPSNKFTNHLFSLVLISFFIG